VYRDNVTEGIKSGRGNYWMVPTGSQRFVRVLSLCHLPSNKTCLGGVTNVYKFLVGNSEGKSLIAKLLTLK
jgi:hypothetical protein